MVKRFAVDGFFKETRQLKYLEHFLVRSETKSIVVEEHYFDRDYTADFSAFYSASSYSYRNCCGRLHFFSQDSSTIEILVKKVAEPANDDNSRSIRRKMEDELKGHYLGFSVIRPLDGAPIGKTVIKPLTESHDKNEAGNKIKYTVNRPYTAHLFGLELSVMGIPFQQQDRGVSACATVALWTTFSHLRWREEIAKSTPAIITSVATQYNHTYGRAMPSSGLSLEQMSNAIHAVGLDPAILNVKNNHLLRQVVSIGVRSHLTPILVIRRRRGLLARHAVVVAGVEMEKSKVIVKEGIKDLSTGICRLYVNDDRIGPYADVIFASDLEETQNDSPPHSQMDEVPYIYIPDEVTFATSSKPKGWKPTDSYWQVEHLLLSIRFVVWSICWTYRWPIAILV